MGAIGENHEVSPLCRVSQGPTRVIFYGFQSDWVSSLSAFFPKLKL